MTILGEAVVLAAVAVLVIGMVWGALSDLASYEIPNTVSLVVAAAFVPAALAAGLPLVQLATAFAIAAACLVGGIGLYAVGLFGGGDVKLLSAGAVWAGAHGLASYLIAVAISGGLLSLVLVIFRRLPLPARLRRAAWVRGLHDRAAGVPYGVAIAAGAIAMVPELDVLAPLADGALLSQLARLAGIVA
ncbi:MAG TPA: prepilin peptidase [Alphaproteobacteria bacterium]